ncbi:MAG: hypothetical protein JJ975_10745 [Bacteroidia bacterium]|nr:hypothetical protein [Bacteroidia bacterium]
MNNVEGNFKILLIASEILIPVIVLVGAYYIFKPMIQKNKEMLDQQERDVLDREE